MLEKPTKALVTALALPYFALVVAWLILRATPGEEWSTIGQLNAGGIYWFLPLAVLLPVALLARARWATLCLLAVLVAAVALFGRDFVPPLSSPDTGDAPRLRVLTYNALVSNFQFDDALAMVEGANADVVLVQELSHEMADAIDARLGATHPYRVVNPWGDPRGIGLWSRFPLEEVARFDQAMWEGWAQAVRVDVQGRPLYLMNVHLWPIGLLDRQGFARSLRQQHQQAATLRDHVALIEGPVIVAGDLNASPTNRTYGMVDQVLDDVWREVGFGPGFTYPAQSPLKLLRIDYQWVRGPVIPLSAELLDGAGSDHVPLVVEYAVGE